MAARGRPRTFDRTAALHRAMELFWAHGYEGTSINELTTALGIAPPSLYAAFGSKAALFRESVEHYNATLGAAPQTALEEAATARAAIEAMLRHNADAYADPRHPTGCMVTLAAATCGADNHEVREFLAACRRQDLQALQRRVERGIADGDVPPGASAAKLARFIAAVQHGMAVQARDGAERAALHDVVDGAMTAWDQMTTSSSA